MTIPKRALDGLRIWAMMFGQEYVSIDELIGAELLQFFVLTEYANKGYLQEGKRTTKIPTRTAYRLTDKALQAIREAE